MAEITLDKIFGPASPNVYDKIHENTTKIEEINKELDSLKMPPDPDFWMPLRNDMGIREGSGISKFTRNTQATYLDGGILKVADANEPRFETDEDGKPLGLVLEWASTNIWPHSITSDGMVAAGGALIKSEQTILPTGIVGDATLLDLTPNADGYVYINPNITKTGVKFTGSVWVKSKEGSGNWTIRMGANKPETTVEISDNKWTRISSTNTITSISGTNDILYIGDRRYGGTALKAYVYGIQVEEQPYPTSYIPTNGSSATRHAELLGVTDMGSICDESKSKTVFCNVSTVFSSPDGGGCIWTLNKNSQYAMWNISNSIRLQRNDGAQQSTDENKGAIASVVNTSDNTIKMYLNGNQIDSDSIGTGTKLSLGVMSFGSMSNTAISYPINKVHIKDFKIWSQPLTEQQLNWI